jgi:hypothetical protein
MPKQVHGFKPIPYAKIKIKIQNALCPKLYIKLKPRTI